MKLTMAWSIEDGRINRTRKFSDPDHYRLSKDGETLIFDDFDEEHGRVMKVEYERG